MRKFGASVSYQGVATVAIDHKLHGSREVFERAMQEALEAHRIELVCLAGFMRLLTPWFVEQWSGRMINIHPAILPSYKGLHTHERALADGVKLHGATVHFVVPEMDAGPIIAQAAVPVVDGDTLVINGQKIWTSVAQYATHVSGNTPGLTLPQLTASAGVAPDSPPQTTESVVIWMK